MKQLIKAWESIDYYFLGGRQRWRELFAETGRRLKEEDKYWEEDYMDYLVSKEKKGKRK